MQFRSPYPHIICMSLGTIFPTILYVHPAKTQISLRSCAGWSEFSLSTRRRFMSLATHWVPFKDLDQTARMCRLIWDFAWCACSALPLLILKIKVLRNFSYFLCYFFYLSSIEHKFSLNLLPIWYLSRFMTKPKKKKNDLFAQQRSAWASDQSHRWADV